MNRPLMRVGMRRSAGILLWVLLAAGSAATAEDVPPPPPMPDDARTTAPARPPAVAPAGCRDCGIVRSIRNVERDRASRGGVSTYMTSDQYLDGRRYSEPVVGPVFGMTFGEVQETRAFVGAAGSSTMRQQVLEIYAQITVRFDDGRHGQFEQDNAAGIRVGDRVIVVNDKVEPAPK